MVITFNVRKGNSVYSSQPCKYDAHYGMLPNSFQNLLFIYTLIQLNTSDVSDGPISGVPWNFVGGGSIYSVEVLYTGVFYCYIQVFYIYT